MDVLPLETWGLLLSILRSQLLRGWLSILLFDVQIWIIKTFSLEVYATSVFSPLHASEIRNGSSVAHVAYSLQDPFLRISRVVESGAFVPICKTEVVNNNLNPIWRPLSLSTQQFGSKASCL